ncbi:MAG: SIR2 family protein [bacterium]|nr:SIR2 family protein [bacterium]
MPVDRNRHRAFATDVQSGGVTLVLGAGASLSRGVPSWGRLVHRLWRQARPYRDAPTWLTGDGEAPHPLALQILVEELESEARRQERRRLKAAADTARGRETLEQADLFALAERQLVEWLTDALYENLRQPADDAAEDTLATLARLLREDQRRDRRLIRRVISFNADDLLETETNPPKRERSDPILWTLSRGSQKQRRSNGANGRSPIPVYHPHGFLPRRRGSGARAAPDVLVFTDAQYWDSVSRSSSFANRVMMNALYDSNCIFLGLSMTDVNLMRWLGLRYGEVVQDKRTEQLLKQRGGVKAESSVKAALDRHYWIRPTGDDPDGFITNHLRRRGVRSLAIDGWGEPLRELLDSAFSAP